ncbi:hypothetical protein C8A00DRAFT_47546 [Chaetomidium leptoderma]|uniref:Uncharacterized protein n=1 Tax=Chaetomidium leptoderma TaxID=669021 RepID=A0AAN6VD12_9PEZI|nr:hypothetical protein C8A00DRAFT_47546 [Chaetomidium leptoderma]
MLKAVRRYNPLWAGTGSRPANVVGVVVGVEPASGQDGEVVHGPTATPFDQGQGPVSDLSTLRPPHASRQARLPPQNADIPPVTFPGGRNPYLDRPLPPPPSKNISAGVSTTPFTMPARPSTSSGPVSGKASGTRPTLEKRLSKDDMALTGRMVTNSGKLQPYLTGPKALWLLTPEPSPQKIQKMRVPSPASAMSPPATLPTPQSSASGEIQIGMALGSPTQDSTPNSGSPYAGNPLAGWQPQSQTSVQAGQAPSPAQIPEPTVQRTKTQKRRLFGSLFGGRKHAEPPKAVETVEANRSTSSITISVSNDDATPARSNTVTGKKAPKHKPIIVRSRTESQVEATTQEPSFPVISEPIPSLSTSGAGLLNIDIPDIRLERYSVMFSGVLKSNGTKSSLLERRQATLEKLKTISDRIEEEGNDRIRPRRATSPQPMKSPAFSLFPQTPTRHSGLLATSGAGMASTTSLAPPRALSRSNTSPAYLPSPSRANFEPPRQGSTEQPSRKERKTVTIISPRTMDERNRAAQVEKLREQQQAQQRSHTQSSKTTTTTFHFGPSESGLILDSPQSMSSSSSLSSLSEDETNHPPTNNHSRRPGLKPTLPEPQWEIITPPSSTSSSPAESAAAGTATTTTATRRSKHSTSTSTSTSSSSIKSRPSLDTRVSVDEQDAALKAAVEISIARQISISRQQRRLLRPFGQGGTTMSSSGSGPSGARARSATLGGAIGGGGGGRIEEEEQQQQQQFMVGGVMVVLDVVE